jgi:hypothetical protein
VTVTGVGKTSAGGVVTLTNGDLIYSAPNTSGQIHLSIPSLISSVMSPPPK